MEKLVFILQKSCAKSALVFITKAKVRVRVDASSSSAIPERPRCRVR